MCARNEHTFTLVVLLYAYHIIYNTMQTMHKELTRIDSMRLNGHRNTEYLLNALATILTQSVENLMHLEICYSSLGCFDRKTMR